MKTNLNYAIKWTHNKLKPMKSKWKTVYSNNEKEALALAELLVIACPGIAVQIWRIETGEQIFPYEAW
jgi:hypothetical protein